MKAAVIDKLGAAPHATACADPSPATGSQVLVKVEATALNAIDLHVAEGHHRAGPPQLPYVPGIEVAGTIVAGPDQGLRVRAAVPAQSAGSSSAGRSGSRSTRRRYASSRRLAVLSSGANQ